MGAKTSQKLRCI